MEWVAMPKVIFPIRQLSPETFSEQLSLVRCHLVSRDDGEGMAYLEVLQGYVQRITRKRYNPCMQERIQKILSARGICSRRTAEEYIKAGLVKVNGVPATLGQKADPETDLVEVDGKVIEARKELLYYLLNKPVGVVTTNATSDTQKTVSDLLPKELRGKIFPVGRLDKDTSGLLLLTNDGVLAYRLTHPKFDHEKEYEVRTTDPVTEGQLMKLKQGLMIDGSKTKPAKVLRVAPDKFRITLTEGRNRQIRRMCQKVGAPLRDLTRMRIMTLTDEKLRPGALRALTSPEIQELLASVGVV